MLSQMEKHQLKQYCDRDPRLSLLIRRLEEAHHMELSRVSHEIRNPVTLINSFLQLTVSQHPEVASYRTWKSITENMDYLKLLLNELSDYNNSGDLKSEELSLSSFLRSLVDECRYIVAPLELTYHKETAVPPCCFDKIKLRAALLNLIRNAAEALSDKTDGRILVSLSFDGSLFRIRVVNNGPQIPDEYIDGIFEPFVTHKKDGTGLGLAIVRNIVQAHGGTVSVTSDPEKTCFTLCLP